MLRMICAWMVFSPAVGPVHHLPCPFLGNVPWLRMTACGVAVYADC